MYRLYPVRRGPEARSESDATPLHWAAEQNEYPVVIAALRLMQ